MKKVVVGLSGGVDSAVSAKILVDKGFEVIGVFMKNWQGGEENCTQVEDLAEAERVAKKLGIELKTVDFSREYWDDVFQYFLEQNKLGKTPNPDVLCNKYVKFKPFLEYALNDLQADFIATGHYAKIRETNNLYNLEIPTDKNKDQTYFLHQLDQFQLSKTLFPLENLEKPEVKNMAKKFGFSNFAKPESMGICFIGSKNYQQFLHKYLPKKEGLIKDLESGKTIGKHQGVSFYTIGQSQGVGIGGVKGFSEGKWFVVKKDLKENVLLVSQNEENLLKKELKTKNFHWISDQKFAKKFTCMGKIRYRDAGTEVDIEVQEKEVKAIFKKPVRAITSGQYLVIYKDDICLGGGEIM